MVSDGSVQIAQAKAKTVVLQPGGRAYFVLGAAVAYGTRPPITFRRVSVAIGGSVLRSAIRLPATRPPGKPFPIGVTAFTAVKPPVGE